jgi:phospholipase D1/2
MARARRRRKPAWGRLLAIVLACAALAAAWRYTPLSEFVTAQRVIAWARAVRETPWAPIVVVLVYTPAAFVMFPRPLLTLLTVVAFGPWLGFAYGMVGILLAALATYYAGRILRPATVERLTGDVEHVRKVLREHGLAAMTAIRIVPAAPFALEGIIAGAMRLKLWHFMLGTFIGMTPGVLATSVFGNQLTRALEDPSTINWWVVAAVVVAFAALTWFVKRWFARH